MKQAVRKKKRRKAFVVTVQDFGAAGDGLTDNSEAFERARRCRANKIKMPPGVYVIGADVQLDARFHAVRRP